MLVLFFVFCLPSLLVVIPAISNFVWKLTVLVTEYSHYYILLLLGFLFFLRNEPQFIFAILAGSLAMFLLLKIHFQAFLIGQSLDEELAKSYNFKASKITKVYSIFKLFDFKKSKRNSVVELCYDEVNKLKMKFYPSKDKAPQPCVILVHGGAWDSGDYGQLPELNYKLANNGIAVAAINYRLAPKYQYPAPIEDVAQAIAFLKKESNSLNIAMDKLFLMGRSAGGQIALCAACLQGCQTIKGLIAYYTPADLVWGYAAPGNPWILDSRKVLENYLGGTYEQAKATYEQATASNLVNETTPPILMIHGKRDEMVAYEHNIRLIEHLTKFKINYHLLTLPWATHGGDYNIHGPMGQLSSFATINFIKGLSQ